MDLDVRHLRLVVAIADHTSLTRAGDVLNLTQSALSHQLRDIEDRLGARLFHRLNRRMVPTPAGERLLASARSILAELAATEDAVRRGGVAVRVPLRISTECYTCYHWLPSVLPPFRERFPHVEVRIDSDSTNRPLTPLFEGRLDLAIMSTPVRDARLVSRPLFEDEVVAVMAPSHPLARQPFLGLEDFRREKILIYGPREESYFLTRLLGPAGVVPESVEPVQLTEALIELARAGLGIAVLARWAVEPRVQDGSITAVRITEDGYRREWSAVMPKHLDGLDYIDTFVRLVSEHTPVSRTPAVLSFPPRRPARARG
jgi:LysR family transcriptional regulator, regulator for metE and metH